MAWEEVKNGEAFEDGAYGWDDEIQKDSDFVLLPPGTYDFEVADFERGRYDGGEKMGPCPKAIITLRVKGPNGEVAYVKHNLFLHSKCEGLLSQFFIGIGLKKHGEKLKMQWNKVVGRTGRCKLGIREYNGNEYNEVKKILDPGDAPKPEQVSFTAGSF